MCYHKLYIFTTCGHTVLNLTECVSLCSRAASGPTTPTLSPSSPSAQSPSSIASPSPSTATTVTSTGHDKPLPPRPAPTSSRAAQKYTPSRRSTINRRDGDSADDTDRPHTPQWHPYQTFRLHTLCAKCRAERATRLEMVNRETENAAIRFEEWRWRVAYANPGAESRKWMRWGEPAAAPSMMPPSNLPPRQQQQHQQHQQAPPSVTRVSLGRLAGNIGVHSDFIGAGAADGGVGGDKGGAGGAGAGGGGGGAEAGKESLEIENDRDSGIYGMGTTTTTSTPAAGMAIGIGAGSGMAKAKSGDGVLRVGFAGVGADGLAQERRGQ